MGCTSRAVVGVAVGTALVLSGCPEPPAADGGGGEDGALLDAGAGLDSSTTTDIATGIDTTSGADLATGVDRTTAGACEDRRRAPERVPDHDDLLCFAVSPQCR